ncbi:putative F420-0 ABC transporter permease subunit [Agromyces sp. GXS1127]|uniref:putative F420-0 ABC transporter permease subunit n=1 Tax=Agromyces sp. GXS1127 TaxID=3424181 RepID=UPI003D321B27
MAMQAGRATDAAGRSTVEPARRAGPASGRPASGLHPGSSGSGGPHGGSHSAPSSGDRTPRRAGTATAVGVGVALVALLAASVVLAVTIGPAGLAPGDVLASIAAHLGLGEPTLAPLRDAIVWELRMPRVLTAAAVGAGLAICGVVMQALTRNPLADPYLLGLSSGASVGAVIVLVLGMAVALPVAAFAGALAALAATLGLARAAGGLSPTTTVLAGLAVSAVFGAVTSLVIFWSATTDSYREILNWLLGSLAGAGWPAAALAGAAIAIVGLPLLATGRTLDAFAFGDTAASALGVHVPRTRALLLVATALLTGALVAVSGAIGFVGLILPHAVRLVVGARHRALLPLSALAGAIFLVWVDTGARTLFDPRELPVGILTALVGGPVFAALLLRARRAS